MFRILVGLMMIACLVVTAAGCGGGEKEEGDLPEVTHTPSKAPEGQSRSMIPEKVEKPRTVVNVFLRPYLDEAGELTELAVTPGETFPLYLFAEYKEPYHISAVEFRLDLPEGVQIGTQEKFRERALTMGEVGSDFVLAFQCAPPGKYYVMKFTCHTFEDFEGGEISVTPGVNSQGESFLGYVACEPETLKLPATGGSVKLTKK
jgi:hypothetical protein